MLPALLLFHLVTIIAGSIVLYKTKDPSRALKSARWVLAAMILAPFLLAAASRLSLPEPSFSFPFRPTTGEPAEPSKASGGMIGATAGHYPVPPNHSFLHSACVVWIFGIFLFLARFGFELQRLVRHLKRLTPLSTDDEIRLLRRLPRGIATDRLIILSDPEASAPYSFRFRRPTLILTPDFFDQSPRNQACILRHELSHLQHGDTFDTLLWRLATCFYWWNPAIHRLSRRLREQQEWRADGEATQWDSAKALGFSRILIDYATFPNHQPSLENSMASSSSEELKRRIHRLMSERQKDTSRHPGFIHHGLILIILLIALGACSRMVPNTPYTPEKNILLNSDVGRAEEIRIEKKLRLLKDAQKTDDLIQLEYTFYEHPAKPTAKQASTRILTPEEKRAFRKNRKNRKEWVSVSYTKSVALNGRAVSARSVVNHPVVVLSQPDKNATAIEYLPVGTVLTTGVAILKSGEIHCETNCSFSRLIGKKIIGGNTYPVVSSNVFAAPLKVRSGHTICVENIISEETAQGDKAITMLITPTRKPPGFRMKPTRG